MCQLVLVLPTQHTTLIYLVSVPNKIWGYQKWAVSNCSWAVIDTGLTYDLGKHYTVLELLKNTLLPAIMFRIGGNFCLLCYSWIYS